MVGGKRITLERYAELRECLNPVRKLLLIARHPLLETVYRRNWKDFSDARTRLHKTEQELQDQRALVAQCMVQKQKAELLAKMKTNFANTLCHDLRNQLAATMAMVELFEKRLEALGVVDDELADTIRIVHTGSIKLREIICSTLDLSGLEAGKVKIELSEVDVGARTAELAGTFLAEAKEHSVYLKICGGGNRVPALANPGMLDHILINLISNALKFTTKGGVTVNVENSGSVATVKVSDTGPGINQKHLAMIFEEYAHFEDPEHHEGTGLGLAIAKRYAELMHGKITVSSELGKGTTFTLTLLGIRCESKDSR